MQADFSDDADRGGPALVLRGEGLRPREVTATGARARVTAKVTGGGRTWRAVVPLRTSRWGGALLPLPSGTYALAGIGADDAPLVFTAELPSTMLASVRAVLRGAELTVAPPVDLAYDSGAGQDALERRYAERPGGLENAVFFESFYGRNVGCNPRAIDRELARVAPGIPRYWSVVDLSVEVPEGAIAVVEGSPEWWRARGSSRLLVVNDWLRRRFVRRRGQTVLQTWHGTPLKRLALDRPGFDPRRIGAVLKEARRWNVLLAQNPYGARIMRRAYAFRRPLWVEGYPRNDVLVDGDGTATRKALGIGAGEKVLLYAPTWRDDRDRMVDFLDLPALAEATDAVVLVRGHSRTLPTDTDRTGPRVVDVTAFPDVSQLLLAADALITDYSSVMFDFSVTGKPLYFLTPDLAHYRGQLRGFYFDLAARAPGPVVSEQDDLVAAITDDGTVERYRARYDAWRAQFNVRDDGRAAERVVARILDQGYVTL